jgi:hypothetical protein
MTDASGHNKDMPDGVIVRNPLPCKKQNAYRIKHAARQKPEYA